MTTHHVAVDVATMWTAPDAPREVDGPAVADLPDVGIWASSMSKQTRAGLHGRTLTQLLRDEPVDVIDERDDWVEVVAPWQPHHQDARGYPGWVRRAHLAQAPPPQERPAASLAADALAIAGYASRFLGLRYLWGGTSPWGLDCSGLVHHCYRQAGVVVPRDAHAQHAAATPVPLGEERPGDLYFFAREDGPVYHVGFVTARLYMLHAPEETELIEDTAMSADRRGALVAAGRLIE